MLIFTDRDSLTTGSFTEKYNFRPAANPIGNKEVGTKKRRMGGIVRVKRKQVENVERKC